VIAILFNVKQAMATLETTTDLQFSQKTYSVLVKRNYKHESMLSTYALNIRTTTKFSIMSQALYIYQISLEPNNIRVMKLKLEFFLISFPFILFSELRVRV